MLQSSQPTTASFAQALNNVAPVAVTPHHALTHTQKTIIACIIVFVLPLIAGTLIPLRLVPTAYLRASATTQRTSDQLDASSASTNTDAIAVADQSLIRAETASDPSLKDRYVALATNVLKEDTTITSDATQVRTHLQAMGERTQQIAAPGETTTTSFGTTKTTNGKQGTIILKSGESEVQVAYPSLSTNTQIYLQSQGNKDNSIVYIASKQPGVGFRIGATAAVSDDVVIHWVDVTSK